jgi:hypothetical protein
MHLTYRHENEHTEAALAAEAAKAGAPDIEITPEMMEAGTTALARFNSDFETDEQGVFRIYREMERARVLSQKADRSS